MFSIFNKLRCLNGKIGQFTQTVNKNLRFEQRKESSGRKVIREPIRMQYGKSFTYKLNNIECPRTQLEQAFKCFSRVNSLNIPVAMFICDGVKGNSKVLHGFNIHHLKVFVQANCRFGSTSLWLLGSSPISIHSNLDWWPIDSQIMNCVYYFVHETNNKYIFHIE